MDSPVLSERRPSTLRQAQGRPEQRRGTTSSGRARVEGLAARFYQQEIGLRRSVLDTPERSACGSSERNARARRAGGGLPRAIKTARGRQRRGWGPGEMKKWALREDK